MSADPSEALLARASELMEAKLGLHYPPQRWRDLERGLAAAATDLGEKDDLKSVVARLEGDLSAEDMEILAQRLTIGETYFFREAENFAALRELVFPELIRSRQAVGHRRLRIWSAGCCTGEEPYSLAMLLEELLPDIDSWNISLLATDLNVEFLRRAEAGVYKEWSFRQSPPGLKERFFHHLPDGRRELLPRIRQRVRFAYLNLAEPAFPFFLDQIGPFDLILCRNVLMYFSFEGARRVVERLRRRLGSDGWLMTSPAEASSRLFQGFQLARFRGASVYQKAEENDGPRLGETLPQSAPLSRGLPTEPPRASPPKFYFPLPSRLASPNSAPAAKTPPLARSSAVAAPPLPKPPPQKPAPTLASETRETDALLERARLAADAGRLDEALNWCDRALAAEKLNPAAYRLLAAIAEERGRLVDAEIALKAAFYLDPEFPLTRFALGHAALRLGKREQADRHFAHVLDLLRARPGDEEIPESGGLTASDLIQLILSMRGDSA